jgi:hypothetical protein
MTKFLLRWQLNHKLIPANPEDRVKLWISMHEMAIACLESGASSDWRICNDASAGYAFAEGDEKTVYTTILKRIPYVSFDIKPVLTVD